MQLFKRAMVAASVAVALVVGSAGTALADDSVAFPSLVAINSARDNIAVTFEGQTLRVCQTVWESANRLHRTCRDTATADLPYLGGLSFRAGEVFDVIYYDGTVYTRENTDTMWVADNDPNFSPDDTILGLVTSHPAFAPSSEVVYGGIVNVAGVQTQHFQFWSKDSGWNEFSGGQSVANVFIDGQGRVVNYSYSSRGPQGILDDVVQLSDINANLKVSPPAPQRVIWPTP